MQAPVILSEAKEPEPEACLLRFAQDDICDNPARRGLVRPLLRVAAEPGPDIGTGGHDPSAALAGVLESGADQGLADALAAGGRRDLRVLQVQDVLRELALDQLALAVGEIYDEAGAFRVVANGDLIGMAVGQGHGRKLRESG